MFKPGHDEMGMPKGSPYVCADFLDGLTHEGPVWDPFERRPAQESFLCFRQALSAPFLVASLPHGSFATGPLMKNVSGEKMVLEVTLVNVAILLHSQQGSLRCALNIYV